MIKYWPANEQLTDETSNYKNKHKYNVQISVQIFKNMQQVIFHDDYELRCTPQTY